MKCVKLFIVIKQTSRSREGAWIEIVDDAPYRRPDYGRSREGAWIEISLIDNGINTPSCRSREGAWIEIAG